MTTFHKNVRHGTDLISPKMKKQMSSVNTRLTAKMFLDEHNSFYLIPSMMGTLNQQHVEQIPVLYYGEQSISRSH